MQYYHVVIFMAVVCFICAVLFYYAYRFRNPYKLIMIFGKKGSGKTTLITKLAYKNYRRGRSVYSTIYTPFSTVFDVNLIGSFAFPDDSVILIDEVGMIWDNRNFKNFRTDVRDYFKLQRHYRNTVYLFSQTFDIDVKLRNLTDCMYLVKCHFGVFSVARKIKRNIVIVSATADSESRIADNLEFTGLLSWLFDGAIFTWVPHWVKYFDSFERMDLAVIPPDLDRYKFSFKDWLYNLFLRFNGFWHKIKG